MKAIRYLLIGMVLGAPLKVFTSSQEPIVHAAPLLLENVSAEMLNPGFWISKHPAPNETVMNSMQIEAFNASVRKRLGSVSYMPNLSGVIAGSTIRKGILAAFNLLSSMKLYDKEGERLPSSIFNPIKSNLNLKAIPNRITIRHGFPHSFADQKLVPSEANYNKKPFDYEFNEVQNSGYDMGTPLVLYHNSKDGKWVYGSSSVSSGWFRISDICFVDFKSWKEYQNPTDFVVISSARADVWRQSTESSYQGFARMGSRFPLLAEEQDAFLIAIPSVDSLGSGIITGRISKNDAHKGFLPYTAEKVYTLAFKMLHQPYGWADTNGDTDCSSYLRQLFLCFGIELPRNGAEQEKSASILQQFTATQNEETRRKLITQKGMPGISLLRLPGHITLYLGSVDGKAYIIHNTWAERKKNGSKTNDLFIINRVVTSDVMLNHLSTSGSLLKRFTSLTVVKR